MFLQMDLPTRKRTTMSVSKFFALARTMVSTLHITSIAGIYDGYQFEPWNTLAQACTYPYRGAYSSN